MEGWILGSTQPCECQCSYEGGRGVAVNRLWSVSKEAQGPITEGADAKVSDLGYQFGWVNNVKSWTELINSMLM